jgi:hypothetical protein
MGVKYSLKGIADMNNSINNMSIDDIGDDNTPWVQDEIDAEMGNIFGSIGKAISSVASIPASIGRTVGGTIGGVIGGKSGRRIGSNIGNVAGMVAMPSAAITGVTARAIGTIVDPRSGKKKTVVSLSGRTGMTADGRLSDGASSSQPVPCACGNMNTPVIAAEAGISSIPRLVKERLQPEIKTIHNMLARAQIQREATSEHNNIMGRADFQRRVLTDLDSLASRCGNKPAQGALARFRAAFGL